MREEGEMKDRKVDNKRKECKLNALLTWPLKPKGM